jgi:hypothetical protein
MQPASTVHHPMRVMITAPAASTFEGDKWVRNEARATGK